MSRGHDATLRRPAAVRHGTFGPVLEPMVAAALAAPGEPDESTIEAAGIPFHVLAWGDPDSPRLLLMHGVTSNARGWWRVGPALAAAGYRVIAPDMPGHGLTGHWVGHHAFLDNAADLVAFGRAALPGVAPSDVRVVGHSWGAMTAAAFPASGYVPMRLVLVDPPAIPLVVIEQMLADPSERRYDDVATAVAVGRPAEPDVVVRRRPRQGRGPDPVRRAGGPRDPDRERRLGRRPVGARRSGGPRRRDPADPRRPGVRRPDPRRRGAGVRRATRRGQRDDDRRARPTRPHRTHPVETTEALLSALR